MTLLDGVTQGSQGIEIGFGPPIDATGLSGTNDAAAASLEDLGNGLFELTLPIRLEISPEGAQGPASILLQGAISRHGHRAGALDVDIARRSVVARTVFPPAPQPRC